MDQKFKIGDSVVLRLGSRPKIVIDDRLGEYKDTVDFFDGTYQCAWYDIKGDIKLEILPQENLIKTKDQMF
jgi:uncharacterized protein YodC (DUF2158 family)